MKAIFRLIHFFILLSAFHLSLQMAGPTLPGAFLNDTAPALTQKSVVLLPFSNAETQTVPAQIATFEQRDTLFAFGILTSADLCKGKSAEYYSSTRYPEFISTHVLCLTCILRV